MTHHGADEALRAVLAVVSFVGFAGVIWIARLGYRRYQHARSKAAEAWGDLFGRDPVMHPNTHEVVVPATPGIGMRLTTIERWQEKAANALEAVASTQSELVAIHRRVEQVEGTLRQHITDERDRIERDLQTRSETERQMWSAIEAVANASPAIYREQ